MSSSKRVYSLDPEDTLGNPVTYGFGGDHRIKAFSRGHTRVADITADPQKIQEFLHSPKGNSVLFRVGQAQGAGNAAFAGPYDDPYINPVLMHYFLCSSFADNENHRWTLINWVTRICSLCNADTKIDGALRIEVEADHVVSLIKDPVDRYNNDLLPGEESSGYTGHPIQESAVARNLRSIICDPTRAIEKDHRLYFLSLCIELVFAWQRGAFDDLDFMREETYIEGMLNTVFSRGKMTE